MGHKILPQKLHTERKTRFSLFPFSPGAWPPSSGIFIILLRETPTALGHHFSQSPCLMIGTGKRPGGTKQWQIQARQCMYLRLGPWPLKFWLP